LKVRTYKFETQELRVRKSRLERAEGMRVKAERESTISE
jgi:hypothetical protein